MVAELSLQIAGGYDAPSAARSALRRYYRDLPGEVMQLVALLTSELVSNAVKHARADPVVIRFAVRPEQIRVEVTDEGPGFSPDEAVLDPARAGGWGLHLVNELSSRWGVIKDQGARVWFEIDR